MNLYTYAIRTMTKSPSIDKHYNRITAQLNQVILILDELVEDPIFLDTINSEQEISLDLALEVLDSILAKFEIKQAAEPIRYPLLQDDSYDADWYTLIANQAHTTLDPIIIPFLIQLACQSGSASPLCYRLPPPPPRHYHAIIVSVPIPTTFYHYNMHVHNYPW